VARDLHDGVQNELVSLILGLSLAEDDPDTPPELAASLSVLRAGAQSTLSGIREIAHGVRPPLLAAAGVVEALRAQAALARIPVNLVGAAPRSSDNAEEAVYFACLEAPQKRGQARVGIRERHAPTALPGGKTRRPDRGRWRRVRPDPWPRGRRTDQHPRSRRHRRGQGENPLDTGAGDRGGRRAPVAGETGSADPGSSATRVLMTSRTSP
jgi:hypothetical protein